MKLIHSVPEFLQLRSNSNCKYSPCCCRSQIGSANFLWKGSDMDEVCQLRLSVQTKNLKNEKSKFTTFARNRIRFKVVVNRIQSVRSPCVHGSKVTKNEIRSTKLGIREMKAAVRLLSIPKFSAEVSSANEVHQTTKIKRNAVTHHGYPRLPESILNSCGARCGKVRAYV